LNNDFVQQTSIMELPCKVTTSDNPDVLCASGGAHLGMNRSNISLHYSEISLLDKRKGPAGKDPGRLCIWPGRTNSSNYFIHMTQHPFISGRPHGQRTHFCDE